jgi:hypothetical protein
MSSALNLRDDAPLARRKVSTGRTPRVESHVSDGPQAGEPDLSSEGSAGGRVTAGSRLDHSQWVVHCVQKRRSKRTTSWKTGCCWTSRKTF